MMTRTQFYYKNHRGAVELRTIEPVSLQYVASPHLEYGYAPGWFLHGLDFTERDGVARKGEPRSFSLDHIQMEGFKYGTKGGAAAFHLMLTVTGVPGIEFTAYEIQSGLDRVRYAELLIRQLPDNHDGRNTWLALYGTPDRAEANEHAADSLAYAMTAGPSDMLANAPVDAGKPDLGTLVITAKLVKAQRIATFNALTGILYGHATIPNGTPLQAIEIQDELPNDMFRTVDGSIYHVTGWKH